jgi:hypothetical protein
MLWWWNHRPLKQGAGMKASLAVCSACMRHVRVTEIRCPFCAADVPESLREQKAPAPVGRLSRAALVALRAGALSMSATACGGDALSTPYGAPPIPVDASVDGGETVVALYGAFYAPDASLPDGTAAGNADAAPQDAGEDHPILAVPYGLPPH